MAKAALIDPADAGKENITEEEFETLDVSKIKVEVLPEDAAKASHPFDGYPVKKIKILVPKYDDETERQVTGPTGKKIMEPKEFNLTHWVLHNHIADPVHQDRSNRRHKTFHSRSVMDIRGGNSVPNIIIQFATPIKTATGEFYGALVPDPYIRSQLIFKKDREGIKVDKRYMLLDMEQKNRLKQCFFQLIKPQQEMEKAADQITAGEEPAVIRDVERGEQL